MSVQQRRKYDSDFKRNAVLLSLHVAGYFVKIWPTQMFCWSDCIALAHH